MAVKTLFVDPSRCIGCRACEAACRECDSHKGESMVMVDFVNRGSSVATQPTVCMHCQDPLAPCAQVCPAESVTLKLSVALDDSRAKATSRSPGWVVMGTENEVKKVPLTSMLFWT